MKYMNNSNIVLITRNNASTLFFKISIIKFKKKRIQNE